MTSFAEAIQATTDPLPQGGRFDSRKDPVMWKGVPFFSWAAKKIFGTRNQRQVNRYLDKSALVNEGEEAVRLLTDAQLRAKTSEFRDRITAGEAGYDLIPEIFAVAREAMDRAVGIRNIFNPESGFDPDTLPDDARRLYDETKATMDATEPAAPEGDFLGAEDAVPSWLFVDIPNRIYEAVRELHPQSRPPFRARPFDVQLIGGIVLSEGRIAEMKTGEGKTIVGPLACYLACCEGRQVHVVTVNDYLVQRDRDWTFPFFRALGLTVGAIHPMHMQAPAKKKDMYDCDVVYGTTAEFGFDYLRDNMKLRADDQVQRRREFAIVDEVDSILIDEARTPLIISGPAHSVRPRYELADGLARHLVEKQKEWTEADDKVQSCMVDISGLEGDLRNARDKSVVPGIKADLEKAREALPGLEAARDRYTQFFEVELDKKSASLTHEGVTEAQRKAGIGSFYVGDNIDLPHLLEQSLRAHVVYVRDRDYVVAPDEGGEAGVVIVDQNTGRKMVGRQWSDGLHQAVEAKEGVQIKDETQTMATITIQNFFKMYDRLAGMTGTADTEATEFHEIYRLDVVSIPTNVPIERHDRNDFVYLNERDKWEAIVDEIARYHEIGRPVLVGTTSVDRSEMLSRMLTKKHRVPHEVLNAKHHEREADIVANAGQLGAIMIATNMAGRGTDIKLGRLDREQQIEHWKKNNICPKEARPEMSDEEIIGLCWRHLAARELGMNRGEAQALDAEEARRLCLLKWAADYTYLEAKAESRSDEELMEELDHSGKFLLHRLAFHDSIEAMGGLHIVGTERHESRRIDNQLRGRAGRQGDNGSSRFFLSLEDDLMKMFAGKKTLYVLSKLGMKEGDSIEHPMLSRSVENAQRKVEERNFTIRKNILEYDEPMEHQRQAFYAIRQPVLENLGIKDRIFGYIEDSVQDEAERFLAPEYRAKCISEWIHENLGFLIEPDRLRRKERDDLHRLIRSDYLEDGSAVLANTCNEYLSDDIDREEWDVEGFIEWARTNSGAELEAEWIRSADRREVVQKIEQAMEKKIEATDLSPLDRFLVPDYGSRELVSWANNRLGTEFDAEIITGASDSADAASRLLEAARSAYRRREIEYPIDFAVDMTTSNMASNPQQALQQFCAWARARYELNWSASALPSTEPSELRRLLVDQAEKWDGDRIAERAARATKAADGDVDKLNEWFTNECLVELTDQEREQVAKEGGDQVAQQRITELLRSELSQFERWVMLQILDSSWKDHLHSMDQIRDAIGFRAFSQRDPRIEFKRESARLFNEMEDTLRERVTDIAFKGKLQAPRQAEGTAPPSRGGSDQAGAGAGTGTVPRPVPEAARRSVTAAAAMLAEAEGDAGTEEQRRDLEIAEQAGSESESAAVPKRKSPAIGRNEIVTIENPKTGERQERKWKKAKALVEEGWRLV